MSMHRVFVRAPSNIALIKYMGKEDASRNLPANPSISLTLNSFSTFCEVSTVAELTEDRWIPELPRVNGQGGPRPVEHAKVPDLSEAGVLKVLRHVARVRSAFSEIAPAFGLRPCGALPYFELRTANTFPTAAGIASSASSFAAITLGVAQALCEEPLAFEKAWNTSTDLRRRLAQVARQGSGSSCRSFEGPWVLWDRDTTYALPTRMPEMVDFVLLVGREPKKVSSSEAHNLVCTSPLWNGRSERVSARIRLMQAALGTGDLAAVAKISWAEMWEMHSLFHTCEEPFTYWEPGSIRALNILGPFLKTAAPPVVTMDAGANVHLLVSAEHAELWRERLVGLFPGWEIPSDRQGSGASVTWVGSGG